MKSLEKIKILDGASLKWIAMASMLIDHVNKGILTNLIIIKDYSNPFVLVLNNTLEVLGRIAFPIFLFLLVEGFFHTRSRLRYFLSLMGFGILAEIPYDMFESGVFFDGGAQNMYFTLALALLIIWSIDWILNWSDSKWYGYGIGILIGLSGAYLASYLALDYHIYGILIPVVFYLFREKRWLASGLSYLIVLKELWSVLGFSIVNLYNGKRGQINKWFCYLFYPIHLFIIGVIRMYVMKF